MPRDISCHDEQENTLKRGTCKEGVFQSSKFFSKTLNLLRIGGVRRSTGPENLPLEGAGPCLPQAAPLRSSMPQAARREGALERVGCPQVTHVLGREVVEGQKVLLIGWTTRFANRETSHGWRILSVRRGMLWGNTWQQDTPPFSPTNTTLGSTLFHSAGHNCDRFPRDSCVAYSLLHSAVPPFVRGTRHANRQ